jgi:uncharacterized delta-60 repeat protein
MQPSARPLFRSAGGLVLVALALLLPGSLLAAPDGPTETGFLGKAEGQLRALTRLDDGRLLAVGTVSRPGRGRDLALVRLDRDGSPDPAFGREGIASWDGGDASDYASAVAIQADGKVLVAGRTRGHPALLRFHPDGSLDPRFGADDGDGLDGAALWPAQGHTAFTAMARQPDGKILATATLQREGDGDMALLRFNRDGTLDTGFGSHGGVARWDSGGHDTARAVAVRRDGRILVAGETGYGESDDLAVVRFTSRGRLDPAFGTADGDDTDGAAIRMDEATSSVRAMGLQADGKLLVAGALGGDLAVSRFYPDGLPDSGFGRGGTATWDGGPGRDRASAVALQPDGGILAAGTTFREGRGQDMALVRFRANGGLDASFGERGASTRDPNHGNDYAHDLALRPGGALTIGASLGSGTHSTLAVEIW